MKDCRNSVCLSAAPLQTHKAAARLTECLSDGEMRAALVSDYYRTDPLEEQSCFCSSNNLQRLNRENRHIIVE